MSVTALQARVAGSLVRGLSAGWVIEHGWGLALWRRLVRLDALPARQRVAAARRVAARLLAAGRGPEGAALLDAAAGAVGSSPAAAEASIAAVSYRLALGEVPPGLAAAVAAMLAEADRLLAGNRLPEASLAAHRAAEVLFHRSLHFDAETSPLAEDPAGFLAAWRASGVHARLTEPHGRRVPAAGPGDRAGRPHRLLLVTYRNWNFLQPLAEVYQARAERSGDVEVRRLDLADLPANELDGLPLQPAQQLAMRLTGQLPPAVQQALAEPLAWADTVFVDWCQRAAVLLTSLDPGRARVIVRLHSFEAFTVFPHLVDLSRVDDLVFVGSHVARFATDVLPALAGPGAPRVHALPNVVHLDRFARPKDERARFTLAVIGYAAAAKDACWAVDVLAALRRDDPRYRLLLVGDEIPDGPQAPATVRAYGARLRERLAGPDVAGAVERVPFTRDVPELLQRVGVILSSSVRESFHLALVEGAASGAVPVVRRWPMFARYGGPAELFPADWLVDTPEQAAARIRAVTADPEAWLAGGRRAREHVLRTIDWTGVRDRYDALLVPSPVGAPAGSPDQEGR